MSKHSKGDLDSACRRTKGTSAVDGCDYEGIFRGSAWFIDCLFANKNVLRSLLEEAGSRYAFKDFITAAARLPARKLPAKSQF
jgi:hypothetical protein